MSTLETQVGGLANGLGEFFRHELPLRPGGSIPVFRQVLDTTRYTVAFDPGSPTFQILANDQNRFSPPRSLPPILALDVPEEEDNHTDAYVLTRFAYSDGAFRLLEDLLREGHVFGMNAFLELAWWLARPLAYLHGHGIVHGQWNARSVVAIPVEDGNRSLDERPEYRYELLNTGVCFRDAAAIPREYLERGYYPPEVFVSPQGAPDYGALDITGDVYCFASFLKDLMQRACSTEELPSQAARILEGLQREANRRSWKASPDALRRKELEILDHLYTTKVRSEALIQEGLRPRDERSDAARILGLTEDLHEKATSYLRQLYECGFAPINVFGVDLQHYTTFKLIVSPSRINSFDDCQVILTGSDLPHEFVRVTLNERHEGVQVLAAAPGRIEFRVECGFPSGCYRISINNRRTDGTLEVYSPVWKSLQPTEVHHPWAGFGNIQLTVRGRNLPAGARYTLWSLLEDGEPAREDEEIEVVTAKTVREEESPSDPVGTPENGASNERAGPEDAEAAAEGDQLVVLELPADTPPGPYMLNANFLDTGLLVRVKEQLPDPVVDAGALPEREIKNHRAHVLTLSGRNFHPKMIVDLGTEAGAAYDAISLLVRSSTEARLTVAAGFLPGDHVLRVNFQDTPVRLRVVEPRWTEVAPASVKFRRRQAEPAEILLQGKDLPRLSQEAGSDGYALTDRDGEPIEGAVLGVEEVESEKTHRLRLSAAQPRGRPGIRFGQLDTGLAVRVRRQLPRSVLAAIALILVLAVGALGLDLQDRFGPRITGVAPATVFDFAATALEIEGANLARLELWTEDDLLAADLPLTEIAEQTGTYACTLPDLSQGKYRVVAAGEFFGRSDAEQPLIVRTSGFRLEPKELQRFTAQQLQLSSAPGFDVATIRKLQLFRSDGDAPAAEFTLQAGRAEIPGDKFTAKDTGRYEVGLDGRRVPLEITVVGPRLDAIAPNPATPDAKGRVEFAIRGTHLGPDLFVGIAPAAADAAAPPARPKTLHRVDGRFAATLAPGDYQLVWGPDESSAEPVPGGRLRVFPRPSISSVTPLKLEPGRKTKLTFAGINLTALDRIVLRPVEASLEGVEIPLRRSAVQLEGELKGRYEHAVALRSGVYLVEPGAAGMKIEVFADCRRLLDAFATQRDHRPLLDCLRQQRPTAEVTRSAADLFFDRGLFAEAQELYENDSSAKAQFRRSFLRVFLDGKPIPLFTATEKSLHAEAARCLGWGGGKRAAFAPEDALPWELEFIRGLTTTSPQTAVSAFESTIRKKAEAGGEFSAADFEPAHDELAKARLRRAVELIGRAEFTRAQELIGTELLGNHRDWRRLDEAERCTALFWHGHLRLWYAGDTKAAVAAFRSAIEFNEGDAVPWCHLYLAALVEKPGGVTGEPTDAPTQGKWEDTFVRLFRFYREIYENPNFNVLTERDDPNIYLSDSERKKSVELHKLLARLEALPPRDPLAHLSLLYYLRHAQRIAWPEQEGGEKARTHRTQLAALAVSAEFEALRRFFILLGDLGSFDLPQFKVLPRAERKGYIDRLQAALELELPGDHQRSRELLRKKFLTPSTVWRSR